MSSNFLGVENKVTWLKKVQNVINKKINKNIPKYKEKKNCNYFLDRVLSIPKKFKLSKLCVKKILKIN